MKKKSLKYIKLNARHTTEIEQAPLSGTEGSEVIVSHNEPVFDFYPESMTIEHEDVLSQGKLKQIGSEHVTLTQDDAELIKTPEQYSKSRLRCSSTLTLKNVGAAKASSSKSDVYKN